MLLFASFTHFIHKFIKEGEKKMPCRVFVPVFYVYFFIFTQPAWAHLKRKKSYYVARLHDLKIYE